MALCVCVVSPPSVTCRCLPRGVEKMLNVPTAAALSAGCSLVAPSPRPDACAQAPPLEGFYGKRKRIARGVVVGTGRSYGADAASTILAALATAGTSPAPSSHPWLWSLCPKVTGKCSILRTFSAALRCPGDHFGRYGKVTVLWALPNGHQGLVSVVCARRIGLAELYGEGMGTNRMQSPAAL